LRVELENRGCRFRSDSDTEVLLHAYQVYGASFVSRLRGMFAFCIYDPQRQIILLARDRLGKKPLYYHLSPQNLIFASGLKALQSFPSVSLELDHESIKAFLVLQFIPGSHTIYKHVHRLPPASCLELDISTWQTKIHSYWCLTDHLHTHTPVDILGTIDSALADSVQARLTADVEVGLLLSGGVDSSLISWYGANLGSHMRAFTASFDRPDLDETPFARAVSDSLGSELVVVNGGMCTQDVFSQVISHLDEPLGDPACVPTFLLSQEISRHVKVVLSGEGADELFNGYHHYRSEFFWPSVRGLQPILRHVFTPARIARWEIDPSFSSTLARIAKVFSSVYELGAMRWTTVFSEPLVAHLLGASSVFNYLDEISEVSNKLRTQFGSTQAAIALDLLYWLPDDLLVKVDRMTMAHGVEARTPFLDHELVSLAMSISPSQKISLNQTKTLLRKLVVKKFYNPLGRQIAYRPKHGLETNTAEWLLGPLRSLAEERLSPGSLASSGIINPIGGSSVWKSFLRSGLKSPLRRKAWLLFVLQSWLSQNPHTL
jgi:asparagine synthase (glutamine-hydrolysing)